MLCKQILTASFKNYHISLTADDEYLIISLFTVTQNQIKEMQELDDFFLSIDPRNKKFLSLYVIVLHLEHVLI